MVAQIVQDSTGRIRPNPHPTISHIRSSSFPQQRPNQLPGFSILRCIVCNHHFALSLSRNHSLELANSSATLEDADSNSSNQKLVLALYDALRSRDSDTVVKIVAPDLEWWFHGPPSHQFLMRMLTGQPSSDKFDFVHQSITSFGPTVLVEGCDNSRSISWVHAWTVTDGIITQVREYFNTSLTVTRFSDPDSGLSTSSPSSSSSEITSAEPDSHGFPCVWESSVSNRVGKSVPGLVLAI